MRILLSEIIELERSGEYRLVGWTRKKNNRIDGQSQRWLQGHEYFFSSHEQKKRNDKREMKRRANQDAVRQHHHEAITLFLKQYRHAANVIRDAFIPNYNTVVYDDFQLSRTIQRLFRYGLVDKDIECEKYAKKNFSKKVRPETYWKSIVKHLNQSNIKDAILNPITLEMAPELRLYKKIKNTFTRWYIDRMFSNTITETLNVFGHCEFYAESTPKEICNAISDDFQHLYNQENYRLLFTRLRITPELLTASIQATLNETGRQAKFEEWAKKAGAYKTFQDILSRGTLTLSNEYSILGIQKGTSASGIKRAFREKCRLHHPDMGGNAYEFIKVVDAYEQIKRLKPEFRL